MKTLGFVGSTVVGSLSKDLLPLLDELDSNAARAGSVNTVAYRDGIATGYKTDGPALLAALAEVCDVRGKSVDIAGRGKLAKEIVPLLLEAGAESIVLFDRNQEAGQSTASSLGVRFGGSIDAIEGQSADILINATPIGARSCDSKQLIKKAAITNFGAVLDTSFDPGTTELVGAAKELGVPAANGLRMFALQGAAQVGHYFGVEAPVERIEQLISAELAT